MLEETIKRLRGIKVEVAKSLVENITTLTPIDSGQAKANWFTKEGSPDSSQLLFRDQGVRISQKDAETISRDRVDALVEAPVGDVYITNNLDYIRKLENGFSQQAPGGMVAVSVHAEISKRK